MLGGLAWSPYPEPPQKLTRGLCIWKAMNRVSPTTLNSIKALCEDSKTTIVIFSGSAKVWLSPSDPQL